MNTFRRLLSSCGPGGIKCRCCKPKDKNGRKKCRSWTRKVRQMMKRLDWRES